MKNNLTKNIDSNINVQNNNLHDQQNYFKTDKNFFTNKNRNFFTENNSPTSGLKKNKIISFDIDSLDFSINAVNGRNNS